MWKRFAGVAVLAVVVAAVLVTSRTFAQPRPSLDPCRFTVTGKQFAPHVAGPRELVARLSVVPQPDSPIEIVDIDLSGMHVALGASTYQEEARSEYVVTIRNRSDQPIRQVEGMMALQIVGTHGTAGGGRSWKSTGVLMPGQTVRVVSRSGGGHTSASDGELMLTLSVDRVMLRDCAYLPSKSYFYSPRIVKIGE